MSRVVAVLSTALLLVVSVGFIAYVRFIAPPGGFFRHGIDTPAIVRQVQQMNDLVTVRYIVEKVIALKQDKVPLGSESILLLVQARVLAGVHLSDLNQYDVSSPAAHTVRIRLPQPRILDAYIHEKQTKVWDRRITWWTPWVSPDPDLEHQARMAALEEVKAAAIEQGILNDAARNARESISNLLRAAGITDVQFTNGPSKPQTQLDNAAPALVMITLRFANDTAARLSDSRRRHLGGQCRRAAGRSRCPARRRSPNPATALEAALVA